MCRAALCLLPTFPDSLPSLGTRCSSRALTTFQVRAGTSQRHFPILGNLLDRPITAFHLPSVNVFCMVGIIGYFPVDRPPLHERPSFGAPVPSAQLLAHLALP